MKAAAGKPTSGEERAYLKEAGILFGFSVMAAENNLDYVGDENFIDDMISRGCRIGFYVGYVPSAKNADARLVPDVERQAWLHGQVKKFKQEKRIILVHMPDDEYELGGTCMAAARGFVHVNSRGGGGDTWNRARFLTWHRILSVMYH